MSDKLKNCRFKVFKDRLTFFKRRQTSTNKPNTVKTHSTLYATYFFFSPSVLSEKREKSRQKFKKKKESDRVSAKVASG